MLRRLESLFLILPFFRRDLWDKALGGKENGNDKLTILLACVNHFLV